MLNWRLISLPLSLSLSHRHTLIHTHTYIYTYSKVVLIEVGDILMQNAQHFESNSALCKVCTNDASYIVRWSSFSSSFHFGDILLFLLVISFDAKS